MTETPEPEVGEALARARAEEREADAADLADQIQTDERIVDTLSSSAAEE